jgi:arylsulfatase A-like enzyme/Flp pilus assembly protein TadD
MRQRGALSPKRPDLWKTGTSLLVLAILVWWWLRVPPATIAPDPNRNVLLVTIDTLRADALGAYGGRAATPNLDRLASRGTRFDFAHAHAVVTLPSHASILSGLYPYQHGIRDNTGYRFDPAHQSAATRLKSAGFATGAFVGGFPLDRRFGLGAGFDVYDDRLSGGPDAAESGERERRADAVVAAALEWTGRQSARWFSWVHVYDPHVVYAAPPEWAARYPSDPYLAEVAWTDAALGVLFDRLAARPDTTLVIVTSDHGESLGDHGEATHSIFAYEPTLRVPLVVAEIGGAAERRPAASLVVTSAVRHVDILPTILASMGAAPDATLPGAPLQAASDGAADRPSYFEALTPLLTRGWAPLRGVVVGREKYIDLPIPERYDLATDPEERENKAARAPERVQVLVNTLKGFDLSPPGRPRTETAETLEQLRSLGYIGGGGAPARESFTDADDPKRLIGLEQAIAQATSALQARRPADAIPLLKDVIARRPDTEDAYRKLALAYWRLGRPADSIATLESALRAGITQPLVRIKLAEYLAQAGRPAQAVKVLETISHDDPDALIALGNALEMAGRRADALATFRRLASVDPASGVGPQNIGVILLESGDLAGAEAALQKALEVDPGLPAAHTALGVVLARTGRLEAAVDAWRRAVEIDGAEFNALYNLVVNLWALGRRDEARTFGERFLATAPPAFARDAAAIRKLFGV